MSYDGIPQEISYDRGSVTITFPRAQACSYWWRETRLIADGRTFLVRLAAAAGLAALLEARPRERKGVRALYGLTDDEPMWSVEDVTDSRQVRDPGVLPADPKWVMPPTPLDTGHVSGIGAGAEEDELMRISSQAIVRYLRTRTGFEEPR